MRNTEKHHIYFAGALFAVPLFFLVVILTNGAILPHLQLEGEGQNVELFPYMLCAIAGASLAMVGLKTSDLKKRFAFSILLNVLWFIMFLAITVDMWGEH